MGFGCRKGPDIGCPGGQYARICETQGFCTVSDLPTARDYAGVHRVYATCLGCDRWSPLDLDGMIRHGLGDVPLIHLPLQCAACGGDRFHDYNPLLPAQAP